jgi:hypothetical protein
MRTGITGFIAVEFSCILNILLKIEVLSYKQNYLVLKHKLSD